MRSSGAEVNGSYEDETLRLNNLLADRFKIIFDVAFVGVAAGVTGITWFDLFPLKGN